MHACMHACCYDICTIIVGVVLLDEVEQIEQIRIFFDPFSLEQICERADWLAG